jgi:glycosyltransferase involved in cell wall biosynthesis
LTHQAFLAQHFSVPVLAIPHHHANFNQVRITVRPGPALTLGYVGHKDHWPASRFITKLGYPVTTDFEFRDLERTFLDIDIGIALRKDRAKTLFNSSLKLLNFMSFGIPCVVSPELSYLEVARHGAECLYAQDEEDGRTMLKYLAGNDELRRKISDQAFSRARDFHISKIAVHYTDYLKQFFVR